MKTTYIYAIQEDKLSHKAPVKIGLARNVEARLTNLQVGNPTKLIIRAKIGPLSPKEASHLEKKLHRTYNRYKIRGEWFSGKCLAQFYRLSSEETDVK